MRISFISFIFVLLASCSNLSQNMNKEGVFIVKNGQKENKSWDEKLIFKRVSWFQDLTMLYDLLLWRVEKSPFQFWFSKSELESIAACSDFIVAVDYGLISGALSSQDFINQIRDEYGYQKQSLEEFSSHLKLHPDFARLSSRRYRIYGLCRPLDPTPQKILVSLPGFKEISVLP